MTSTSQLPSDPFMALADGLPTSQAGMHDGPEAESLRLLTDVRNAFRDQLQARQQSNPAQPQFTWGELRVFETLGQGGYGTVYRAHDPWLARDVALKLFTSDVAGGSQLIKEARLLAGLRHANVLLIHGAAVHDGRVGYWSEWLQGMTLGHLIERDGAFSVDESLRIARDLASAIHAVHRIGLVHGDVKAENVMRESGGRVVLMDFGASGSTGSLAARLLVSGTPRYLAPEVLNGAPMSAASDWYAFGVTMYLMLAGEFPFPSLPYEALCEAKRRAPPSVMTRRPDLAPELAIWIDALIAPDPAHRPDPSAIAHFLAMWREPQHVAGVAAPRVAHASAALPSGEQQARPHWPLRAIAVLLAILLGAIWFALRAPPWEADARFLRISANGDEVLAADTRLALSDRFYLQLRSNRPSFIYVLNEDADGIATVLYPTTADANPVPAGVELRLPGTAQSRLAWQLTSASAHEEFVVISAIEALPALEAELRQWRQVAQPAAVRGAGAVVAGDNTVLSGARLLAAMAEAAELAPDDARVWQFRFSTQSDQRQSPEATKPAQ
jgi:serine/threonine protein kinase